MFPAGIIGAVLVLLTDWYLWKKFFRGRGLLSILWWLPTILLGLCVAGAVSGLWHTFFMRATYTLVFVAIVPKFIFVPVHKLTGSRIALGISALAVIAFIYGMTIGFHKLEIKEEVIEFKELPTAFDGYRIVHLSDLHLGTYSSTSDFPARVVDSVLALKPDLIVFTGDLVNVSADEARPFIQELARLHAPDGVFSITGNHDYGFVKADVDSSFAQICAVEEAAGWTMLNNASAVIRRGADSLYIAGVENTSKSFFISRGDLTKALEGTPSGAFKILLTHDPKHWRSEVLPASDVNLTLSGHTHAMQLKVLGLSPAALLFREWGGCYREEDRALYVSEGIGGILPFRIGSYPQIVLITLKKK